MTADADQNSKTTEDRIVRGIRDENLQTRKNLVA